MQTIWKGAISFGLVHIPVKMHSATQENDISFRMLHKDCGSPINTSRNCEHCQKEIDWNDVVKGYEYDKNRFVTFEKDELEQLSLEKNKEIKVIEFVKIAEIDPIYYQKTYYLSPDEAGTNAYNLLLTALQKTKKIAICKVSIRSRSSLAILRVIDNCLVMETVYYPDEIRPVSQVPNIRTNAVNDIELDMAVMLINKLSVSFEPSKYKDEGRERIVQAIQTKIAGKEFKLAPEVANVSVLDLMTALQESLNVLQTNQSQTTVEKKSKPKRKKATPEQGLTIPSA